jgi:isoquinoline 1-oxidoreductase beta subunit
LGETVDVSISMGAREQPYRIKNYRVTACAAPQLLPVGWWRGVGESQNAFFHETIIDELAHEAGRDPLLMRLALLEDAPSRQVLEDVAEMSGWDSPLPEDHGRGVAFARSSGAATAQVIEIGNTAESIRLLDAWIAVDVGIALDPRNIEGQLQGGLVFALTAAMMGEITLTDGKVGQTNLDNYPLLRMYQMPKVHVSIHENGRRIFGVGEAAVATTAPALGNAIFSATGKRLRELPFSKSVRFV